jgi:cardiolipin synthase
MDAAAVTDDSKDGARGALASLSARDLVRVPGLISLSRVPLAALFPLAVGEPRKAFTLLAAAGASDLLDGWYARRFHQQTSTGAVLDGVTDKLFVSSVALSLVMSGSMSITELLLVATRDVGELVLGLRLTADRAKRDHLTIPSANVGGKIATTLQYAAIAAVLVESRFKRLFVGAAALGGLLASIAYWRREVAAAHA